MMNWCRSCIEPTALGLAALGAAALAMIAVLVQLSSGNGNRAIWVKLSVAFTLTSSVLAIWAGLINALGAAFLVAFAIACYLYRCAGRRTLVALCTVTVATAAVALAMHLAPGFSAFPVLSPTRLCEGCQQLWLLGHFDKPVVGLLVALLATQTPMVSTLTAFTHRSTAAADARVVVTTVLIASAVTFGLLVALGAIRWDPKTPPAETVGSFVAVNLFLTTFAEEIFFRAFVHDALRRVFPAITTTRVIAISGLIFGVAHVAGGPLYVLGATLAGIGYGYVYERTRGLHWAIATHFLVNVIHFFFFSYPRLAT